MVGSQLKALAEEWGFRIENGVAYGERGGYLLTMYEQAGGRMLGVAASLENAGETEAFLQSINTREVRRRSYLAAARAEDEGLALTFNSSVGSMKRYRAFIEESLLPRLAVLGAQGAEACPLCGAALGPGERSHARSHKIVYAAHDACLAAREREIEEERQAERYEPRNTGRGILGALLGGLLGSIPWIVAYYFGWFVGWLGYVIGWCAKKGYALLGGRPSKAKLWIVTLTTLLCVVAASLVTMILAFYFGSLEQGASITLLESAQILLILLSYPEFWGEIALDLGLGMLFAFLGLSSLRRELREESAGPDFARLPAPPA